MLSGGLSGSGLVVCEVRLLRGILIALRPTINEPDLLNVNHLYWQGVDLKDHSPVVITMTFGYV